MLHFHFQYSATMCFLSPRRYTKRNAKVNKFERGLVIMKVASVIANMSSLRAEHVNSAIEQLLVDGAC